MIMVALLFVGGVQVYGQSFKVLLNKGKDVVGPVVEQLDVIPKNIEGNWEFSGSAVKFTGDNVLMNAASELAAGKLLDFISKISSTVGDSKIGALTSLIDQYDGLKIGFELSRVK